VRRKRYGVNPFDAATVVSLRLASMGLMAVDPSRERADEMRRMIVEKPVAAFEGLIACQQAFAGMMFAPPWLWPTPSGAIHRLARAAATPAAKRVRANARRLRKKSPG
jgi:hypothetical protein